MLYYVVYIDKAIPCYAKTRGEEAKIYTYKYRARDVYTIQD